MASISTGSIVADISGKVGDNIYSRNKGGPYVKQYAIPVQPNSSRQLYYRQLLTDASAAFAALSDSEFTQWDSFNESLPPFKKNGQVYKLSTRALFIRRYMNAFSLTGFPAVAPINYPRPGMKNLSISTIAPNQLIANISGGVDNSDIGVLWSSAPPKALQIRSFNSVPFTTLGATSYVTSGAINLSFLYFTTFLQFVYVPGTRIFVKCKVIHKFSGADLGSHRAMIVSV